MSSLIIQTSQRFLVLAVDVVREWQTRERSQVRPGSSSKEEGLGGRDFPSDAQCLPFAALVSFTDRSREIKANRLPDRDNYSPCGDPDLQSSHVTVTVTVRALDVSLIAIPYHRAAPSLMV